MTENSSPLLEVDGLTKYFPVHRGWLRSRLVGNVKAVDGISFKIGAGETFGLVGESGSGKTTASRVILGVEPPTSGKILFHGKDCSGFSRGELRDFRRAVQAVFQDPYSSLDPRMKVGEIIVEPIVCKHLYSSRNELKDKANELLMQVGLKPEHVGLYPHEFSGGMRQRIAVARSLAPNPELIVLDEPVSALDVSIRAQIMNLLKELQDRYGFGYLVIAHDLATVRHMSHRLGVLYVGKLMEQGDSEEIFTKPMHPYTKALMKAALPIHPDSGRLAVPLSGEIPSPLNPPTGCRLHPRCPQVMRVCSSEEPLLKEVAPHHHVACHLYG